MTDVNWEVLLLTDSIKSWDVPFANQIIIDEKKWRFKEVGANIFESFNCTAMVDDIFLN